MSDAGPPPTRARAGDRITKLDGKAIDGSSDLVAAVADRDPGDTLKVTVRRGSDTVEATITLGTQPATRATQTG